MSTTEKKTRKTKAKGKYYIDKKELLAEVVASKEQGAMSDRLAAMLQLLTEKYSMSPQYIRYSFKEDMKSFAMMSLVHTWKSFKPEKSDNPFAFYTQCIKHSFIQYLNKEKKHRIVRDTLLVYHGMNPSYTYQNEYQDKFHEQHYGDGSSNDTENEDTTSSIDLNEDSSSTFDSTYLS